MLRPPHGSPVCSREPPQPASATANLALLCHDCESGQPSALRTVMAPTDVLTALPLKPEVDRLAWLRRVLHGRGVHVQVGRLLPGARAARGVRAPGVMKAIVVRLSGEQRWRVVAVTMYPKPALRPPQSQGRTRGLPRPDRRPIGS